MADGSGAPAATPNPFGQQQQPMQQQPFGSGQGQMPSFAMPYMQQALGGGFGGGQQQPNAGSQFNAAQNPGANQSNVPDWVQAPEPGMATSSAFKELTNPTTGEKFMAPSGGYSVRQQPDPATVAPEYSPQQQNPYGFDQRAINADPRGFQNYMQQMQQREQQRPGSTMFGQPQRQFAPFGSGRGSPIDPSMATDRRTSLGQMLGYDPGPQQPQQPSFLQDPEYQGYQTQANDLQRQMNEYMQKAPMYQQMQDLQNKMAPFQQRYYQQQQDMQRMQQIQALQQPSPFRRGQFQQPAGIQGLMGMLGGRGSGRDIGPYEQYVGRNNRALASASQEVKQPTMSRADFDAREKQIQRQSPMSMGMPQARPAVMPRSFGREQRYAMPSRDYSSIGSVGADRLVARPAVVDEAPVMHSAVDYFPNSW